MESDLGDLVLSRQEFPVWHRVQNHSLPVLGMVLSEHEPIHSLLEGLPKTHGLPSTLGHPRDCWRWAVGGRGNNRPGACSDPARAQHTFPTLQELIT